MNHFIENKSQAKKALDDEKRKIGQVNSKSSVYVRGLKKQNKQKKMDVFLSFIYNFKNYCPKCYTYKKRCITRNK